MCGVPVFVELVVEELVVPHAARIRVLRGELEAEEVSP
jgi:hypothetical protein